MRRSIIVHALAAKRLQESGECVVVFPVSPQPPSEVEYEPGYIGFIQELGEYRGKVCWIYGAHWGTQPRTEVPAPTAPYQQGQVVAVKGTAITVRITSIRCARLQEVTDSEIKLMGIEDCDEPDHDDCFYGTHGYKCSLRADWDTRHKPGERWEDNIYCWIIKAKKQEASNVEG